MARIYQLLWVVIICSCLGLSSTIHSATLNWSRVTTYTNGQLITGTVVYRIYKSQDGVTFSGVNSVTQLTYVDTGVLPNHKYWYYVVACTPACSVTGAKISVPSPKVSVVIP